MIKSFRCRDTEDLFNDVAVGRFQAFERAARRKLAILDAAERVEDLKVPPGNRLEMLKGNRAGQYQKLMEDLHDLAVVAERRDEKPISLEAVKRRLHKDGLL